MNFEINKTYSCCSICDSNCTWTFKVLKRTAKFVTLEDQDGKVFRKKVTVFDGDEQCNPLGNYSMAPILRADKEVQSEVAEAVKEEKTIEVTDIIECSKATDTEDFIFEVQPEDEEINEPHYVIQHRKVTKKLGIFPSYSDASKWVDKNHNDYKGTLGIYKVRVYDQPAKSKNFQLVGNAFKEVSFYEGQTINESETQGCKATVKYQGGNRSFQGQYKETDTDRKKKNADILIKYANGGSFTVSVKPHVIVKGSGVKDRYDSGNYEVSSNKLKQLQKVYSSMCDF